MYICSLIYLRKLKKVRLNLTSFTFVYMDKENFCFYIKVRTALKIQARKIHDELRSVFRDEAPAFRSVDRWSKLFPEGEVGKLEVSKSQVKSSQ